jgi:hypothetical protein
VDENKYIKCFDLDTSKPKNIKFNLLYEYYVHEKFDGLTSYKLISDCLYEKFKAYKVQLKGDEKKDTCLMVYPN